MRISDWSSDVCSSDLPRLRHHLGTMAVAADAAVRALCRRPRASPPPGRHGGGAGPKRRVTPLGRILARRIAAAGPITVAAYMAEALGHPRYGYYMRGDPLGRAENGRT